MSQRSGASADPFWNSGHGTSIGSNPATLNSINVGVANGAFEHDNEELMKEYGYRYSKGNGGIGQAVPISPLPPLGSGINGMGTRKSGGGGFSLFPPALGKSNDDFGDRF